jgi:hypothetical protein
MDPVIARYWKKLHTLRHRRARRSLLETMALAAQEPLPPRIVAGSGWRGAA